MKKAIAVLLLCLSSASVTAGVVSAEGTGSTKEAAVKNAVVAASEQASGVFLTSDQTLEDGKITKDEIRQHSTGIVNSFEVVSCTNFGSLYNCRIRADVSPAPLRQTKAASGSSTSSFNGATAAAEVSTYAKSLAEGRVLLLDTLSKWSENVSPVVINTTVQPVLNGQSKVLVEYKVVVSPGYDLHLESVIKRVSEASIEQNGRMPMNASFGVDSIVISGTGVGSWGSYYALSDPILSRQLEKHLSTLRGMKVQVDMLNKEGSIVYSSCDASNSGVFEQPMSSGGPKRFLPIRWWDQTRNAVVYTDAEKLSRVSDIRVSMGCSRV